MDIQTLQKGNDLQRKIRKIKEALNCFEWHPDEGEPINLNPRLIIEFDDYDGGRSELPLPMALGDVLTALLKQEIKKELDAVETEFNQLMPPPAQSYEL